ncbi:MAG: glycoside hydrolase [Actinobacteria bacterium]|nr:glycoside hydrolase [Actinomycetota bacterium]
MAGLSIDSHHEHGLAGGEFGALQAPPAAGGDHTAEQAPGGRAVAHYAGGVVVRSRAVQRRAPVARLRPTGTQAAEPTMGIDADGTMFFVGTDGPHADTPFGPVPKKIEWPVLRSDDGGKTWLDVSPRVGPQRRHAIFGLDPMLHVDTDTGRVFTADLQIVACATVSFSDDKGENWTTAPACGLTDHQTVFTGPPVSSPTVGYPNVVYYCAIDGGVLVELSTMTSCLKSLNGGLTWARTGSPAFTDDPSQEHGQSGIPGQPYLAISKDEGLTWTRVQVADNGMPYDVESEVDEHEAGVAVDQAGNLYYVWTGRDRLLYLATSTDGGETWSEPKMIGFPGVTESWGPTIAVGAPGKIAVAYIGSTNAPGGEAPQGHGPAYKKATWNGYITMTGRALARKPVYFSGTVNDVDTPLTKGSCRIVRCDARIYDFIDIQIAPDGTPWTSMVASYSKDGKYYPTWGLGFVGGFVGGPSLR